MAVVLVAPLELDEPLAPPDPLEVDDPAAAEELEDAMELEELEAPAVLDDTWVSLLLQRRAAKARARQATRPFMGAIRKRAASAGQRT